MSFCKKCGNEIDMDSKFCPKCGEPVNVNRINIKSENESDRNQQQFGGLECPHCHSHNVNAQIVTENKNTGCLMVFIYIILALTIIGIPIMIIILLAKGKKTTSKTVYVCQSCGRTFNTNQNKSPSEKKKERNVAIFAILAILFCIVFSIIMNNVDTPAADKSEYKELNPQTLYNDYIDNEISADEKYKGNYFYLTGEIYDIKSFLTDKYLEIRFNSSRNSTKTIEITAYFNNIEDIKSVKKGDTVTDYGKFKQRSFEDYMNVTVFSLENCHLNIN